MQGLITRYPCKEKFLVSHAIRTFFFSLFQASAAAITQCLKTIKKCLIPGYLYQNKYFEFSHQLANETFLSNFHPLWVVVRDGLGYWQYSISSSSPWNRGAVVGALVVQRHAPSFPMNFKWAVEWSHSLSVTRSTWWFSLPLSLPIWGRSQLKEARRPWSSTQMQSLAYNSWITREGPTFLSSQG